MKTIILRITNDCNLSCKYCYDIKNHNNDLVNVREKASLDFHNNMPMLIDSIAKLTISESSINLIFHGGEPLLVYSDLLEEFCKRIGKLKNVSFSIQTNGTLINMKTINFFRKYNIKVGISLDGCNDFQNSLRVFPNGSSSFNICLDKINMLKLNKVRFGLIMSISKVHIGQEKIIYNFLSDNKFKCNIRPVYRCQDNVSSCLSSDEYISFFCNLFDIWYNDTYNKVETYQIHELAEELSKVIIPDYKCHSCESADNCFNNFISLDVYGNLYACNRLYNINQFYYGNINSLTIECINEKINNLVIARRQNIDEICKGCPLKKFCNGGCPAEAYGESGYFIDKSLSCEAKKKVFSYIQKKVSNSENN